MKERDKTALIFILAGFGWLAFAILFDFGMAGVTWCWGVAWGAWFFQRPESARVEKFLARMSSKPWADTADITEARALLALLRGDGKDAR